MPKDQSKTRSRMQTARGLLGIRRYLGRPSLSEDLRACRLGVRGFYRRAKSEVYRSEMQGGKFLTWLTMRGILSGLLFLLSCLPLSWLATRCLIAQPLTRDEPRFIRDSGLAILSFFVSMASP